MVIGYIRSHLAKFFFFLGIFFLNIFPVVYSLAKAVYQGYFATPRQPATAKLWGIYCIISLGLDFLCFYSFYSVIISMLSMCIICLLLFMIGGTLCYNRLKNPNPSYFTKLEFNFWFIFLSILAACVLSIIVEFSTNIDRGWWPLALNLYGAMAFSAAAIYAALVSRLFHYMVTIVVGLSAMMAVFFYLMTHYS